jgi:hypothetical protein
MGCEVVGHGRGIFELRFELDRTGSARLDFHKTVGQGPAARTAVFTQFIVRRRYLCGKRGGEERELQWRSIETHKVLRRRNILRRDR